MVRAKIDAAFAESVTFAPEVDAFDEAISAAIKVCLLHMYTCMCAAARALGSVCPPPAKTHTHIHTRSPKP